MADFSINAIITAYTKQFEIGLKNAQNSVTKLGNTVKEVTGILKNAFVVVGIAASIKSVTDFGKACVQSATEATKGYNILDNVVKTTGADAWTSTQQLEESSKKLSTSTNYSVIEIQKAQSVLLGFTTITGESFEEASKAVLDMATVMSMDLTNAVQTVGKALDDPIKGLDSLRRQGFAFTDEQKEELKSLVDSGKKIEAQKIILDTLAISYGGAAEAGQDSFAKQKHSAENFTETIGGKLLPTMQLIAKSNAKLLDNLAKFISKLDFSQIESFIEQSQKLFDDFGSQISDAFENNIDEDTIYNALNFVYKALQIILNSITAIIHGDWEAVWDYAELVVVNIVLGISKALGKMVDDLGLKVNLAAGIIGGLATGFGLLTGNLAVAAAGVGVAVGGILATNKQLMSNMNSELEKEVEDINKRLEQKTKDAADKTTNYVLKDLEKVDKKTKDTGNKTKTDLVDPIKNMTTGFDAFRKGVHKALINIGKDYEGLKTKTEQFNKLLENMGMIMTESVISSFKTFFTTLGEELVNGGLSWQSMTAVILQSISETLAALGAELTALAAVSLVTEQYHKAAIAAAGAAAAFTASGVVAGIANKMKQVSETTNVANKSLSQFFEYLRKLQDVSSFSEYTSSLGEMRKKFGELTNLIAESESKSKAAEAARLKYLADYYAPGFLFKNEHTNYNKQQAYLKQYQELTAQMTEEELTWVEVYRSKIKLAEISNKGGKKANSIISSVNSELEKYKTELLALSGAMRTLNQTTITTLKSQQDELAYTSKMYDYVYSQLDAFDENLNLEKKSSVLYHQLLVNFKSVVVDLKTSLLDLGKSVSDTLMDGIIDGASKSDFLSSLKSTVRENVLKLAVYTESMQEELANASTELISAISMGDSVLLSRARTNFESIWDSAKQAATDAENFINEVFGDIQDGIEDVTDEIKEMGSSISESLVSGLTEGLTEADFMETMKNYIKGMVVNAVVYTEALQAEIASIGEAISKGIAEGFTDMGLHEIRRDLSYIFNQANNAVSSIDSILESVFTGYATGTDNATAGLHLVGEAGPELVRFRGGEQVYNASETKDILNGAGGNNFNVTFNNMQDTSAYAMLQQMKQWQREMAINGII